MKFSFVFAVVAAVSSVVAPVASAPVSPVVQERSIEARFSGRGTWFNVGLGACGKRNKDSQPIIALNKPQWNNGKLCGKWLTIKSRGKTAKGYIEDMCPSCKKGALDLSPSLFKKFAPLGVGVITVTWNAPGKKRSEINEGDLVIRAGTADDDDETDDDPEFQFDPADAVTDEELAELFGDDNGDDTTEEETTTDS